MENWLSTSATELGQGIEDGKIDPQDLTEAFLNAIDEHPFADRIYARLTPERARAEAKAARQRAESGFRRSPLDGVPISWKDLFDTAGVITESGSAMLKGRLPKTDARVLRNATERGLVCLGKTHQTELAFSGLGLNPVTASPPNIHDHDAVSGGSSSGAGTSVAFGLAAAAIGSDTGGSVRIPSVWNDLVGLKTVHGRLSLEGVVPLCPGFDTVGPLTHTVADAANLLAVLEGGRAPSLEGATVKGRRFGILRTQVFDGIGDAPRSAFENAIERLESAGAVFQDLTLSEVAEAAKLGPTVFPAEAFATWRRHIEADGELMYPAVRTRFMQGEKTSAARYIGAMAKINEYRASYLEATAHLDAVLAPTCPILPPKAEVVLADDDLFAHVNLMALQNTRVSNILGLAAVTLPTGVPSCGVMVQGPHEEPLLRLAAGIEAALA